ncbi:MAG TPA: hypothetical protein EYP23_07055 [Thermoplasmata archaeon]|nr:hypothetical protein [Thermoplasmata archaeon]
MLSPAVGKPCVPPYTLIVQTPFLIDPLGKKNWKVLPLKFSFCLNLVADATLKPVYARGVFRDYDNAYYRCYTTMGGWVAVGGETILFWRVDSYCSVSCATDVFEYFCLFVVYLF